MRPEIIGYTAATLTTVSFLPQVVKAIRSRHTGDLSFAMLTVFALGVALWGVYGLILGSWPIILANLLTLALVLTLVALKIRFG